MSLSHYYNVLALITFLLPVCSIANAQKLPNVQEKGLRVANNIKIDGTIKEWDRSLLAYNHATEIFYCVANDNDYLYLLVSANKREIIEKILLGGVTFMIDPSRKRNDKGVAITFPTYYKNERPNINLKNMPLANNDALHYRAQVDSFCRVANQELSDKSKLIEIEGIKEIQDSLITIYNDKRIKVAAQFDNQLSYSSELAIPIKYLNLNTDNFSYHIKLNGATANNAHIQLSGNGQMLLVTGSNGTFAVPAGSGYSSYIYATDFWGQYTLVKGR